MHRIEELLLTATTTTDRRFSAERVRMAELGLCPTQTQMLITMKLPFPLKKEAKLHDS